MEAELLVRLVPVTLGLTVALVAFLVTNSVVPEVIAWADKMGIVDVPGIRRIHRVPTPRAGGVAVYLGVQSAFILVLLLTPLQPNHELNWSWWLCMFTGSTIVFLTGLLDDLIGVKAGGKLFGQTLAILVVFSFGVRFNAIGGLELSLIQDLILTGLWFLLIINAFNLIDGIDGLAVGLVGISALGVAGFLIQRNLPVEACILFAVVGASLGFLRFNRHPASMFLGDCGSNLLGFIMAFMMICTGSKGTTIGYLWLPCLAVIVPAADLFLAVWRRLIRWAVDSLEGRPAHFRVMTGDLNHLHHRLLQLNLHPRDAAATLYLINALFVLGGLMAFPYRYPGWGLLLVSTIAVSFLAWKYILNDEIERSARLLYRVVISPERPAIAIIAFSLIDTVSFIVSLLVSVRLTHPDFAIPIVLARAYQLVWFWAPLAALTALLMERSVFNACIAKRFPQFWIIFASFSLGFCMVGLLQLSESVTLARAAFNLVFFVAMNFLFMVFSRVMLSIVERAFRRSQNVKDGAANQDKMRHLENINFYGRVL